MKKNLYLLIDQYGDKTIQSAISPRKAVEIASGSKHLEKIYIDGKDGATYHIGYIACRMWYDIFEAIPM